MDETQTKDYRRCFVRKPLEKLINRINRNGPAQGALRKRVQLELTAQVKYSGFTNDRKVIRNLGNVCFSFFYMKKKLFGRNPGIKTTHGGT